MNQPLWRRKEEAVALAKREYRYYDPLMGRFQTEDTYMGNLFDPLSRNLYAYAQGDPINFSDPSGHGIFSAIGNAIKSAVTTVSNAVKTVATAVYNNVVKPVASFVYNSIVQPVAQTMTNASLWVANNTSSPALKSMAYASAGFSSTVGGNASGAQSYYQQSKTYAQAYAAELSAKINKVYCTTSARIKSTSGQAYANNPSIITGAKKLSSWELGGGEDDDKPDWLKYKGEIHKAVQNHIVWGDPYANNMTSSDGRSASGKFLIAETKINYTNQAKKYMKKEYGMADIVDRETGKLWEIKSNYSGTGKEDAERDIKGYIMDGNTYNSPDLNKYKPTKGDQSLVPEEVIFDYTGIFGQQYIVTYSNPADGVVTYNYTRNDPKPEETLIQIIKMALSLMGMMTGQSPSESSAPPLQMTA